jgi:hypothetical protein
VFYGLKHQEPKLHPSSWWVKTCGEHFRVFPLRRGTDKKLSFRDLRTFLHEPFNPIFTVRLWLCLSELRSSCDKIMLVCKALGSEGSLGAYSGRVTYII